MDGGFRGEGQGAQGDYSADDKRGFRGTSENAKTKICMRFEVMVLDSPNSRSVISAWVY